VKTLIGAISRPFSRDSIDKTKYKVLIFREFKIFELGN